MVDNSLGRYWIERHPESNLADKLDFFVTPKDGKITYIDEKIEPEELTFFDPCMGSGHILVYAFDVLMEIYRETGYTDRDAAISILENNLFGLDIDQRAYQLAYFAVMMKARSYNRRLFSRDVKCNVAVINESNGINKFTQANVTLDRKQNEIGEYLIDVFRHAKEIGSLQTVESHDYDAFSRYVDSCEDAGQMDLFSVAWSMNTAPMMRKLIEQAKILSHKYTVVCTNPPYMGKLESHLKEFVVDKYKPYSGDLFSVFMFRNFELCVENGYSAFMTPNVWMFLKSYQALREYIISNKSISSLIQIAKGSFYKEATVDVCSFVFQNSKEHQRGIYIRLEDFKGDMEVQKEKVLEALLNLQCDYVYEGQVENFRKIPGTPIAYWVNDRTLDVFENKALGDFGYPKQGFATGDNDRFLRFWHEVNFDKIGFGYKNRETAKKSNKKWFPCNKGGSFRRWYGNNVYLANWQNDGAEMTSFKGSVIRNPQFYFKEGMTWSSLTSGKLSMRYSPTGHIFESKGSVCFMKDDNNLYYLLGLMNTEIVRNLLLVLSPTLDYHEGPLSKVPIVIDDKHFKEVNDIVKENISLTRNDWDVFESSWDFKVHPLVSMRMSCAYAWGDDVPTMKLSSAYKSWEILCEGRFEKLKANEEKLNCIFFEIYGLQDELTSDIADKDVTIRKADLSRDIKSLLSYAVGCMFGRYSLDSEGIAYAGGEWDNTKYKSFIPDKDNCIPITDEEYFEDDIVGLLCDWLKKVYGEKALEENLEFIAKALGNKGNTSREVIRNYFLNDFIKDHIKIYQKRPIYWMFDSGKQNGFKAICYMHRWNADTIGHMRVEYLHRMQRVYGKEIERMQEVIDNSRDNREISAANRRKEKLQKQMKETEDYDKKVAHLALSRIDIDLDDGVKVNYEKVQTAPDGKKMQILAKI